MRPLPPWRHQLREALPGLSLVVLLAAVFWLQPRTMSYTGLNLMLNLAVPIALATNRDQSALPAPPPTRAS